MGQRRQAPRFADRRRRDIDAVPLAVDPRHDRVAEHHVVDAVQGRMDRPPVALIQGIAREVGPEGRARLNVEATGVLGERAAGDRRVGTGHLHHAHPVAAVAEGTVGDQAGVGAGHGVEVEALPVAGAGGAGAAVGVAAGVVVDRGECHAVGHKAARFGVRADLEAAVGHLDDLAVRNREHRAARALHRNRRPVEVVEEGVGQRRQAPRFADRRRRDIDAVPLAVDPRHDRVAEHHVVDAVQGRMDRPPVALIQGIAREVGPEGRARLNVEATGVLGERAAGDRRVGTGHLHHAHPVAAVAEGTVGDQAGVGAGHGVEVETLPVAGSGGRRRAVGVAARIVVDRREDHAVGHKAARLGVRADLEAAERHLENLARGDGQHRAARTLHRDRRPVEVVEEAVGQRRQRP